VQAGDLLGLAHLVGCAPDFGAVTQ
jgi:hypothetical protein